MTNWWPEWDLLCSASSRIYNYRYIYSTFDQLMTRVGSTMLRQLTHLQLQGYIFYIWPTDDQSEIYYAPLAHASTIIGVNFLHLTNWWPEWDLLCSVSLRIYNDRCKYSTFDQLMTRVGATMLRQLTHLQLLGFETLKWLQI